MKKGVFLLLLSLIGFSAHSSNEMDYNLRFAQPAYRELGATFRLLNQHPGNNPEKQLNYYKQLSQKVNLLKDLKHGVASNFSKSYIGRGKLAKTAYYIDLNDLAMQYAGSVPYQFLKEHAQSIETLPELLEVAVNLSEKGLRSFKIQIKESVRKRLEEEKLRETRMIQSAQDIQELETLVSQVSDFTKQNDLKEQQQEKANKKAEGEFSNRNEDESELTDRMATYAAMLGRATACGIDTEHEFRLVGNWLDRVFPPGSNEQKTYLPIFMAGTEYHMNLQLNGETPDSCLKIKHEYSVSPWH